MNYTLHQLQIFTEVVRHKSVTKAAEAMHMTQPALSIQLKNFQRQFEFPLVEILGKKAVHHGFWDNHSRNSAKYLARGGCH